MYMIPIQQIIPQEESKQPTSSSLPLSQSVDNIALLHLDIVWCLFRLKHISRLSNARTRLNVARLGLERSHGAGMERMRQLQGGFCPELAM